MSDQAKACFQAFERPPQTSTAPWQGGELKFFGSKIGGIYTGEMAS
jgi:hypothetical protein